MDPDSIPIRDRIGRLTRTSPLTGEPIVVSEDDAAAVIAHHWPWIEQHVREQVAQERRAAKRSKSGSAGERIEAIALDLATSGRVVLPEEVTDAIAALEAEVREQVAADILAVDPADWALAGQHAGQDAARIARGINPNT